MTQTRVTPLTYERLRSAVTGPVAAIRLRTRLQPAGGVGDKVFPPTYAGAIYACEDRRVDGQVVKAVLLDSVQSQANRLEQALLWAYEQGKLTFPLMAVDLTDSLPDVGRITTLDAPHRIADAIFRDSLLDGVEFRASAEGKRYELASVRNATALFELCPTALVFGTWDSTGARGGLGNKFARALVSEIVAMDAVVGVRTAGRSDPLGIEKVNLYEDKEAQGGWTPVKSRSRRDAKDNPIPFRQKNTDKGKPSEINHGNVTPDLVRAEKTNDPLPGGITLAYALQTTVLSLAGLRRLRFPDGSGKTSPSRDAAACVALAALALAAVVHQREHGYDLRSRCQLIPEEASDFELVTTAADIEHFTLSAGESAAVLNRAIAGAKEEGLTWKGEPLVLRPKQALVDLVRVSRGRTAMEDES